MFSEYRKPRWVWLYLVLPLTLILFWLVRRTQMPLTARRLLEIGVMLFAWAYVEAWQRLNLVALMHRPFLGFKGWPLYREQEAVPRRDTDRPAPLGAFYSDLFAAPIGVWDSEPTSSPEHARSDDALVRLEGGVGTNDPREVKGSRAGG